MMFEDFTTKCHQCAFSRPFMSCDPRYKKLIITDQSHFPDICHLETEKVEQAENNAQGLNTINVNTLGRTAKLQSRVNAFTADV